MSAKDRSNLMAQREQFVASCNQQASVAMVTSGRTTPRGGNLGIEGALSICPSLSMFLTIHLCPCVWLSMCLIVHVSISVHICLSIVCLSICLPVDLSSWLLTCSVHFLHSPFPLQMHTQGGNSTTGNWRCIIFLSISVHVFGCPCVHLCPYLCIDCLPVHLSTSWSVQLTATLRSLWPCQGLEARRQPLPTHRPWRE